MSNLASYDDRASVGAGAPPGTAAADASFVLLQRAQAGDAGALDELVGRYLPRLQRWASGRLPRWARDVADTQDLVQETLLNAIRNLQTFEPRGVAAFQAYLRRAFQNRIRDELRRVGRRASVRPLDADYQDSGPSPLEEVIGREAYTRYESALEQLGPRDRNAIIATVELGCTREELREVLGTRTVNAARVAADRALIRLAKMMHDAR